MMARVAVSLAFGVLMIGAVAVSANSLLAWGALILAGIALAAGLYLPTAATAAVLLTGCATVLTEQQAFFVALSGLSAAAYLVLRHTTLTLPTALGLVGFGLAGILAVIVPLTMTWLPLVAPIAVVIAFAIALGPLPPPGRRS